MNKNLLFAIALILCFLNQLRPMCNNGEFTKEQIHELEKNGNKIKEDDEELEELPSFTKRLNADINDFKSIDTLWKTFTLLDAKKKIASKKYRALLKKKTIKNQVTRCDKIVELHTLLTELLNKYIEIAMKNKESLKAILALENKHEMIKLAKELYKEEKDILEIMIACVKDMKLKMDSIITEIEGESSCLIL